MAHYSPRQAPPQWKHKEMWDIPISDLFWGQGNPKCYIKIWLKSHN